MNAPIDVFQSKVLAVILPGQLLNDLNLEKFIEDELNAKAIGYYCPHARPAEDTRAIMIEAHRFYWKRGWL